MSTKQDWIEVEKVIAQRDALLSAAKAALPFVEEHLGITAPDRAEQLRAAIALTEKP